MNKKILTITTIALVAVVMGMSAIVPALPQAIASHGAPGSEGFTCPPDAGPVMWTHLVATVPPGDHPDINGNGFVCKAKFPTLKIVIIDDIPDPQA